MTLSIEEQMRQEEARKTPSARSLQLSLRIRAERVLLLVLYHPEAEWIHRLPDGAVVMRAGKLAKILKWQSYDVYQHLDYLSGMGYLEKYERQVGKGLTLVKPRPPISMCYKPELVET